MWSYHTTASKRRFRVNECTLPTYREAALCRHIDVHQSQSWSWIHHASAEQALSPSGRMRLSWLRWHVEHGGNKSLTCRHFAIGRPTLDRWLQRYQQAGLRGVEDRSHRPHRVMPPTWTTAALLAVQSLREQYPYMGKAKLRVLLRREGHELSVSMVGRILHRLRLSGQLHEPVRLRRRRGRSAHRPHAIRKPKDCSITRPGDLVQIDTLEVAVAAGSRFLQLSLVDVCCRWTAAEVRRGKAAMTMRASLQRMEDRLPFSLRAIQIDGGSEFKAEFEAYCQERGIQLFVLPPRSPKLNGMVERLQRSYRDEFYACVDLEPRLEPLSQALRNYEDTYNTIRPHQALGYQTPQQFIDHRAAA
jgi:putative transposase